MNISLSQLSKILPKNKQCSEWLPILNKYLPDWDIGNTNRVAMFLAQTAHESAQFTVLTENLNYSHQGLKTVFPKYFPTDALAASYARNPEKIANRVYANRMGNGDEASGDGWKFRGKSIIQCTGKNNHQEFANFLEHSLEDTVKYLLTKEGSVHYACFFWKTRDLNKFADLEDVDGVSDVINRGRKTAKIGDAIGYEERKQYYLKFKQILSQ